mgnify:FL=1
MEKKFIIIGIIVVLVLALIIGVVAVTSNNKENAKGNVQNVTENKQNNNQENDNKEENNMYSTGKHHAEMIVKDYGTIELELDADIAPITVANFAKLVNEGFYNGLTFHRIISGFMIQGGDPLGNGEGGSEDKIKGEFLANGVNNTISHKRGVISMARTSAYNSASSQFFIVHENSTYLDGQYAGFGYVTSGMEIVDKICEDISVEDNNGTVLKENQPVIEKISMID